MVVQKNLGEETIMKVTLQNTGNAIHDFWLEIMPYHEGLGRWSNASYLSYIGSLAAGATTPVPIQWSWTAGDHQGAGSYMVRVNVKDMMNGTVVDTVDMPGEINVTSMDFFPTDDAFTNADSPDSVFNHSRLDAYSSTTIWMKFDIPSTPITEAYLFMYLNYWDSINPSMSLLLTDGENNYPGGGPWTEDTITHNNRPIENFGLWVDFQLTSVQRNTYVQIDHPDLLAWINSHLGQTITLLIINMVNDPNDDAQFYSKDAGSNPPYLHLIP